MPQPVGLAQPVSVQPELELELEDDGAAVEVVLTLEKVEVEDQMLELEALVVVLGVELLAEEEVDVLTQPVGMLEVLLPVPQGPDGLEETPVPDGAGPEEVVLPLTGYQGWDQLPP